jgi:hypothetical protein
MQHWIVFVVRMSSMLRLRRFAAHSAASPADPNSLGATAPARGAQWANVG